jgi:hypothetical protein
MVFEYGERVHHISLTQTTFSQNPQMGVRKAVGTEVLWASGVWALPFLCALAPSERYAQERGRGHKPLAASRPATSNANSSAAFWSRCATISCEAARGRALHPRPQRIAEPVTFVQSFLLEGLPQDPD